MTDSTNPGDTSARDTSAGTGTGTSPGNNAIPIDSSVGDADRTTTVLPGWVTAGQASAGEAQPTDTSPAGAAAVDAAATERPTIRWGALVWSLLFGATAGFMLWVLVDPTRRLAVGEWLLTLDPLAGALYGLVAVGVILALFGIVGLIRRGERTRRA